jgi:hypothetical protein
VHVGESEDIWINQAHLRSAELAVSQLTERQTDAIQRRLEATNPVSTLVSAVSVFIFSRKIEKAKTELDWAQQLPQPSYE